MFFFGNLLCPTVSAAWLFGFGVRSNLPPPIRLFCSMINLVDNCSHCDGNLTQFWEKKQLSISVTSILGFRSAFLVGGQKNTLFIRDGDRWLSLHVRSENWKQCKGFGVFQNNSILYILILWNIRRRNVVVFPNTAFTSLNQSICLSVLVAFRLSLFQPHQPVTGYRHHVQHSKCWGNGWLITSLCIKHWTNIF